MHPLLVHEQERQLAYLCVHLGCLIIDLEDEIGSKAKRSTKKNHWFDAGQLSILCIFHQFKPRPGHSIGRQARSEEAIEFSATIKRGGGRGGEKTEKRKKSNPRFFSDFCFKH